MKFKVNAGVDIEVATPREVRDIVDSVRTSWTAEVAKGDRFVRFSAYGDVAAAGVVIGGSGEPIGPQPGFVWSVRRIALTNYSPTTDDLALYHGDVSDSAVVIPHLESDEFFPEASLVLYPGDSLIVSGDHAGSGRVWLAGQARELPISLAWRL